MLAIFRTALNLTLRTLISRRIQTPSPNRRGTTAKPEQNICLSMTLENLTNTPQQQNRRSAAHLNPHNRNYQHDLCQTNCRPCIPMYFFLVLHHSKTVRIADNLEQRLSFSAPSVSLWIHVAWTAHRSDQGGGAALAQPSGCGSRRGIISNGSPSSSHYRGVNSPSRAPGSSLIAVLSPSARIVRKVTQITHPPSTTSSQACREDHWPTCHSG